MLKLLPLSKTISYICNKMKTKAEKITIDGETNEKLSRFFNMKKEKKIILNFFFSLLPPYHCPLTQTMLLVPSFRGKPFGIALRNLIPPVIFAFNDVNSGCNTECTQRDQAKNRPSTPFLSISKGAFFWASFRLMPFFLLLLFVGYQYALCYNFIFTSYF